MNHLTCFRTTLLLCAGLLLASSVLAQAAIATPMMVTLAEPATAALLDPPLTIEDVVTYGIANNPQLRRVRLDEVASTLQAKEIRARALPQVNGNSQISNNYALAEQLLPAEVFGGEPGTFLPVTFGVANTLTGAVEVQQMLFDKSFFTARKAATKSLELNQLNTFKSTEDLVYNLAQLYFQIQISQRQKTITEANLDRIAEVIRLSTLQYNEGVIKKIDVDQLRVNQTNLRTQLGNTEIAIARQLNVLKLNMGMDPAREVTIAPFDDGAEKIALTPDLNLGANTSLRLIAKQNELLDLEAENIRAGYYPTLSAFGNYGYQGQGNQLFGSGEDAGLQGGPTGVVGLRLTVPIFDGFRKKFAGQQVELRKTQNELDRNFQRRSIEVDYRNANDGLRQNNAILVAQEQNIAVAEELYAVTQLSYKEGVAPLTKLLDAETSLKEAQSQYLTSLLEVNLAELDLMRVSGQLATLLRNSTLND